MHALFSILLLSLSFISTSYAQGTQCFDACVDAMEPFTCSTLECSCATPSFAKGVQACVAAACTRTQDQQAALAVCDGIGASSTSAPSATVPSTGAGTIGASTGANTSKSATGPDPASTGTGSSTASTTAATTPLTTPSQTSTPSLPVTPTTDTAALALSSASAASAASASAASAASASAASAAAASQTPAFVAPGDSRITYGPSASWSDNSASTTCSHGSRLATAVGASVSFSFTGTGIYLYTIPGSQSGTYTVSIDGQAPQTIDGFGPANASHCDTYAPYMKLGLTEGPHTFVATIKGSSLQKGAGGSELIFAGLGYTGSNASSTPDAPAPGPNGALIGGIVGGVVALLILLALLIWFVRHRRKQAEFAGAEIDFPESLVDHSPDNEVEKVVPPSQALYGAQGRGYGGRNYGTQMQQHQPLNQSGGYQQNQYDAAPVVPGRAGVGAGWNNTGAGSNQSLGDNSYNSHASGQPLWAQPQQSQPPSHGYSYPQQYQYGQYPAAGTYTPPPSQIPAASRIQSNFPAPQWGNDPAARATPPPPPVPSKAPPPPLAPTHDAGNYQAPAGQRTPATPFSPGEEDAYGGMEY